jgi:hypothetical protein
MAAAGGAKRVGSIEPVRYSFSKDRLTGLTLAEVERIFGPGRPAFPEAKVEQNLGPGEVASRSDRLAWYGGRDSLLVWFKDGRAYGPVYVMGF